ncbi:hypothetical protein CPC08DRAFT_748393 [Agrocybe pediades]|nr:hypothetical protein CPC08DRAFT_748393 [Agrocybe pediades]
MSTSLPGSPSFRPARSRSGRFGLLDIFRGSSSPSLTGKSRAKGYRAYNSTNSPRWWWYAGFVVFLLFLFLRYHRSSTPIDLDVPPTWEKLWQYEKDLPQHNPDLPFPEGRHGRYVYFENQIQRLGWNNQLNEVLMNTWLAHRSKRAYVFHHYWWKHEYYPWPRAKARGGKFWGKWPPITPANALLAGPSVGGPWGPGDDAPRSVNVEYFNKVCPKSERRIINTNDVKPAIMWETGDVIFDAWEKLLRDAPERCIVVQAASRKIDGYPQVFDLFLWGSDRILPLWEGFKNSPVSKYLGTSPIVKSAVDRNEYLFHPRGPRSSVPASNNPYDRMLAIHLRRGDYKEACMGLANWNSTFYSWNLLPELPDKFSTPPGYTWGKNTPENIEIYFEHCFPTDNFILEKIRSSRRDYINAAKPGEHRVLDVLFFLTNDKSGWVESLKEKFRQEGWYTIVTTHDLQLDQEQKEVGMVVDMELAMKAAVFIGNGWSSFTSNIVHRRMLDGKQPISTRFY